MSHRVIRLAGLCLAATLGSLPLRAAEVGVSIQVSQPGVYGRIDIGQFPKPQVVVAQPVLIERPPVRELKGTPTLEKGLSTQRAQEKAREPLQPVYMWVPPGHRKDWRRYCREYRACGVPVYFVDHRWYDEHVHPRGKHRGKGRDDDDDDRRGKDRGHDHGKSQGQERGKERAKGKDD